MLIEFIYSRVNRFLRISHTNSLELSRSANCKMETSSIQMLFYKQCNMYIHAAHANAPWYSPRQMRVKTFLLYEPVGPCDVRTAFTRHPNFYTRIRKNGM